MIEKSPEVLKQITAIRLPLFLRRFGSQQQQQTMRSWSAFVLLSCATYQPKNQHKRATSSRWQLKCIYVLSLAVDLLMLLLQFLYLD